jgi:cytoskeletal protein CcmA (bactofilin family)
MRDVRPSAFARYALALILSSFATFALALEAAADDPDQAAGAHQTSDTFVAGDEVTTQGEISGSSVLAGGRIDSKARVHGRVVLLGGEIKMSGEAQKDLYAFGGDVDISGRADKDVRVAGGRVSIGPGAEVLGDVAIAGGQVEIEGKIGGEVRIAGGQVRLNGPVGGDVQVRAGQLQIGPNARIEGRLRYQTKDAPAIDPAAEVKGGVEAEPKRWFHRWQGPRSDVAGPSWFIVLVIGTIMILASPAFGGRLLSHLRTRGGAAFGFGLLCLVATPIALVLCAITIIGLPLAVVLLLAYLLALLLGYVSGVVALAQWGLARLAPARAGARRGGLANTCARRRARRACGPAATAARWRAGRFRGDCDRSRPPVNGGESADAAQRSARGHLRCFQGR